MNPRPPNQDLDIEAQYDETQPLLTGNNAQNPLLTGNNVQEPILVANKPQQHCSMETLHKFYFFGDHTYLERKIEKEINRTNLLTIAAVTGVGILLMGHVIDSPTERTIGGIVLILSWLGSFLKEWERFRQPEPLDNQELVVHHVHLKSP